MIYFLIISTALVASFLTFFSGFGLGTLLLPVFAIYYPLPVAIALTAIVHMLNNVFKLGLVLKNINYKVAIKFGLPSMLAAFLGAWTLNQLTQTNINVITYWVSDTQIYVTWPGLMVGLLIIFFAIVELIPRLSEISFNQKFLILGGIISGFFGGFSGHQGSIRSAFLLRLKLEKSVFIATGVFIAFLTDVVRILYYTAFSELKINYSNNLILFLAVVSAWFGAYFGNKLFRKTTVKFFKWFVAVFMLIMGSLISIGIVH